MRHYAFVPTKSRTGRVAEHVTEWRSRGEADRASLSLVGRFGDGAAVSTEAELTSGDPVPADAYGGRRG